MNEPVTTIYCLCEDLLRAILHLDDPQVRLSTAEVMAIPLMAPNFFGGNFCRGEKASRRKAQLLFPNLPFR
jgi:hypothetical protein